MGEKLLLGEMNGNITSEEQLPIKVRNFCNFLRNRFSRVNISLEYNEEEGKTRVFIHDISDFDLRSSIMKYDNLEEDKVNNIVDYLIKESKNYKSTMLGDAMCSKTSNNEMDSMEEDVSTIINSLPISNQKILKGKLESYIKDNVVTSMEYVFLDSIIRTLNERLEPKVHAVAK